MGTGAGYWNKMASRCVSTKLGTYTIVFQAEEYAIIISKNMLITKFIMLKNNNIDHLLLDFVY